MGSHISSLVLTLQASLFLVPFCWCQSNSSDELGETVFPVIQLGKDLASLYYANLTFGEPAEDHQLRIDIGQPYTWLISKQNSSRTEISLNDGYIYNFLFMDSIGVNVSAAMDTMNLTEVTYVNESDVSKTISVESSSTLVVGQNSLSLSNMSFFETTEAAYYNKGSLGLGGKITNGAGAIDSSKFDGSFFLLDRLVDMGVIQAPSYSLWFGADTVPYNLRKMPGGTLSDSGKLILGAVDPSLYTGSLRSFEMISFIDPVTHIQSDNYPILPLGTIYINSNSGKSLNVTSEEFSEPVLLDTRYTTSYLPIDAIIQIAVQIGATYVESLSKWLVSCSVANLGVTLDFTFDDIAIRVPLEDFLLTTYDYNTNTTLHFANGQEACSLAMVSNEMTSYNVLGGPFLKNVYMAVDAEDGIIAIAQAKMVSSFTDSSASSSQVSTSSSTSTAKLRPISSGYIPYAESRNLSSTMSLFPTTVPSLTAYVPDAFTGTVDSDGLVSTGRSFYQTSRSSTTSKSTETTYESLMITSTSKSAKASNNSAIMIRAPVRPLAGSGSWLTGSFFVFLGAIFLGLLW